MFRRRTGEGGSRRGSVAETLGAPSRKISPQRSSRRSSLDPSLERPSVRKNIGLRRASFDSSLADLVEFQPHPPGATHVPTRPNIITAVSIVPKHRPIPEPIITSPHFEMNPHSVVPEIGDTAAVQNSPARRRGSYCDTESAIALSRPQKPSSPSDSLSPTSLKIRRRSSISAGCSGNSGTKSPADLPPLPSNSPEEAPPLSPSHYMSPSPPATVPGASRPGRPKRKLQLATPREGDLAMGSTAEESQEQPDAGDKKSAMTRGVWRGADSESLVHDDFSGWDDADDRLTPEQSFESGGLHNPIEARAPLVTIIGANVRSSDHGHVEGYHVGMLRRQPGEAADMDTAAMLARKGIGESEGSNHAEDDDDEGSEGEVKERDLHHSRIIASTAVEPQEGNWRHGIVAAAKIPPKSEEAGYMLSHEELESELERVIKEKERKLSEARRKQDQQDEAEHNGEERAAEDETTRREIEALQQRLEEVRLQQEAAAQAAAKEVEDRAMLESLRSHLEQHRRRQLGEDPNQFTLDILEEHVTEKNPTFDRISDVTMTWRDIGQAKAFFQGENGKAPGDQELMALGRLVALFTAADKDAGGSIDPHELAVALHSIATSSWKKACEVWKGARYDNEASGAGPSVLPRPEKPLPVEGFQADVETVMRAWDFDGDGELSFSEFVSMAVSNVEPFGCTLDPSVQVRVMRHVADIGLMDNKLYRLGKERRASQIERRTSQIERRTSHSGKTMEQDALAAVSLGRMPKKIGNRGRNGSMTARTMGALRKSSI